MVEALLVGQKFWPLAVELQKNGSVRTTRKRFFRFANISSLTSYGSKTLRLGNRSFAISQLARSVHLPNYLVGRPFLGVKKYVTALLLFGLVNVNTGAIDAGSTGCGFSIGAEEFRRVANAAKNC